MEGGEILLGDIVLARETCAREAAETGVALEDHATHLIVTGTLHLVGYDNIYDAYVAAMEAPEGRTLSSLAIATQDGEQGTIQNKHSIMHATKCSSDQTEN